MKIKLLFSLLLSVCLLPIFGQTIINAPSINKYANVLEIDYCKNSISIPAGKGGQYTVGDKILLIQMKGASLTEGNNANNGKIDDYNNAGNYEINEVKYINSFANDEIVFKYTLERAYNVSGFVQIVNIPQYQDVVFQNTLTCQAWNGSFGGILAFNATGSVTLNANIDVSEKGFRGGMAEDLGGSMCFGGAGYSNYNCDYGIDCGARKGEGIGNRYETLELARAPNGNGGGGGNDHNAGGGGGSAYGIGGRGGDLLEASCNGYGGFAGVKLNYSNSLNKIFFTGAGGAGDGGNASGPISSTSGGNAGGMVFITANSIISNGNKIISNGQNVSDLASYDGAGGGGAAGLVLLNVNNYPSNLNVELNGGYGGDVEDGSTRCPGPGGGGAGGIVWINQNAAIANLTITANGGAPGINTIVSCIGENNNAEAGENGGFVYNFTPTYSNTEFKALTLKAGSDTIICGSGSAPLWAEANASNTFDFEWVWSSGTNSNFNFDFNPQYSGNYILTANAFYTPVYGPECRETYLVNVDIRKPNISIIASSFFGDTVFIGQPYFVNAVVSPLNANYVYEWKPADRIEPNNERNAVAIPHGTEEACLTVTDELGCSNTECVNLYVYNASIIAANAFSPNSDGLNDVFFPILSEDLVVEAFKVYNRWGDLIYETNENKAWDGTKKGKKQPLDLYIWHISAKQILSQKVYNMQGEVSIVR